jgi:hypothetical protein
MPDIDDRKNPMPSVSSSSDLQSVEVPGIVPLQMIGVRFPVGIFLVLFYFQSVP